MSFVELSIPDPGLTGRPAYESTVDLWEFTVRHANEACLVLDARSTVVAASESCGALLTIAASHARGHLLVDVVRLLDFNAVSGKLPEWEVDKIPPLLAISTAGLARGLIRVPGEDGAPVTFDAVSVPLRDAAVVVGSLTFFNPVNR